jgi:hypothetical protein
LTALWLSNPTNDYPGTDGYRSFKMGFRSANGGWLKESKKEVKDAMEGFLVLSRFALFWYLESSPSVEEFIHRLCFGNVR